jgi:hypothetical protein
MAGLERWRTSEVRTGAEVAEDPLRDGGIEDLGDGTEPTTAPLTRERVDIVRPLQKLSPGNGGGVHGSIRSLAVLCVEGRRLGALGRGSHDLRSAASVRREDAVKPNLVAAGGWNDPRESAEEADGLEDDMSITAHAWLFELDGDPAILQPAVAAICEVARRRIFA